MSKIIFLDVDGTLCNPAGEVPQSAKEALMASREKGHKLVVCTGRSKPEITEDILAIGLDGIIGAGGGYVELNGKVITHKKMPEAAVLNIIDYFEKHDIGYYLESNEGLFGSQNCAETIHRTVTRGYQAGSPEFASAASEFDWFYDILAASQEKAIDYGNVNKISFISNGHPYESVAAEYQAEFAMYHTTVAQFGSESGEIAVKGIDKAVAIKDVLNYTGYQQTQTVAYGDGNNDIAMFQAVGYKVAMANGTDELKALADEITTIADQDGIKLSLQKNGLM